MVFTSLNQPSAESRRRSQARRLGPYSRSLVRGAVGEGIDGRSREGRFLRNAERALLDQIGAPTSTQRLLIRRVAKMLLLAEKLDTKLLDGNAWSPHDARTFGALNNAIARALRDLGLKPASKAKSPPTIAEIAARHAVPKVAAE